MKKHSLLALAAMLAIPAMAQTEFRHVSYQEAVAAAKAENKMLFLDFYTDWCGPCKMMMRDVFPQKAVGDYFNAKFVCLKVNAEKEGKELAKKHAIKAYPTFVMLDANEKVVGTKVGGNFDGKAFVADIDRLVDPNKSPERLKQRYEGGERTADLISAYAGLLMEEAKENRRNPDKAKMEQARKMVDDYFNSLSDTQKRSAENLFLYTTFTESPDEPMAQYLIANREKFDSSVKEEVMKRISTLYAGQVYNYLSGQPVVEADYQALKKGIQAIGEGDKYAMTFRIIETSAKGDANAFLDFCQAEYKNMDEQTQSLLMTNIGNLVKTNDAAVRARASKFIRSQLAEMPLNTLYFATMQLGKFENPKE